MEIAATIVHPAECDASHSLAQIIMPPRPEMSTWPRIKYLQGEVSKYSMPRDLEAINYNFLQALPAVPR